MPRGRPPYDEQTIKVKRAFFSEPSRVIASAVATEFKVPLDALYSATRNTAEVAFARMVAMYLVSTLLGLGLTHVGAYFGRDRTTVRHALAKIEDARDNSKFDARLERLERDLAPPASVGI